MGIYAPIELLRSGYKLQYSYQKNCVNVKMLMRNERSGRPAVCRSFDN